MTRDEIIGMAREAGFRISTFHGGSRVGKLSVFDYGDVEIMHELQRFASLVSAAEREACAKVCDAFKSKTLGAQAGPEHSLTNVMLRQVAVLGHAECADAIRARSAK